MTQVSVLCHSWDVTRQEDGWNSPAYVIVPAFLCTPALPAPRSLSLACYCWQVSVCSFGSMLQAKGRVKAQSPALLMQPVTREKPEKTRSKGTGLNSRSHAGQWDPTDSSETEVKVTALGPTVRKKYWPLKVSKNFLLIQKENWNSKDRS